MSVSNDCDIFNNSIDGAEYSLSNSDGTIPKPKDVKTEEDKETDPLSEFVDAVMEAAKPPWTEEDYKVIYTTDIPGLCDVKLSSYKHQGFYIYTKVFNKVHPNEHEEIPVLQVCFCGTIIESHMNAGYQYLNVQDSFGPKTMLCRLNKCDKEKLSAVKQRCDESTRVYLEKKKQLEGRQPGTSQETKDLNKACFHWKLACRFQEIAKKMNDIHTLNPRQIIGKKVKVQGKLISKNQKIYVLVDQIFFIDDLEEKIFLELVK